MIKSEQISKLLNTQVIGKNIFSFEEINSTNTFAKTLDKKFANHGTLIIAEKQTKGRGRFERKWESEEGKNLLFSIILQPGQEIQNIGILPLCTGSAIAEVIEKSFSLKTECKWPNDILINGKKVCGILIESTYIENKIEKLIIGIGINVNQEIFPDEIADTATSLKKETGLNINRTGLLAEVINNLDIMYQKLIINEADYFIESWKAKSSIFGKIISAVSGNVIHTGKALNIDSDGALILEKNGKEIKLLAGDVTIHK